MSEPSKNVNIKGDQNIVGDHNRITTEYHLSGRKTSFFQHPLTDYAPPHFIPPPFIDKIVTHVQDKSFIIIGGSPEINKTNLARCVAWHVSENISRAGGKLLLFQEWYGSDGTSSLEASLRELEEPAIIILPKLSPQHIAYNPLLLREIAESGQHYIIASSEGTVEAWKLSPAEQDLIWHQVSPDDYTREYLVTVLRQRLMKAQDKLPGELSNHDWQTYQELAPNSPVDIAAEQLKTPDNIVLFVDLLCRTESPDTESIARIIRQVINEEVALRQWYSQLDVRQQLLVATLVILNGLFEDQFFTILNFLVNECWRKRNPVLAAYDYHDLEALQAVFDFVETGSGSRRIENRLSASQSILLRMSWSSHRIYISDVLPHLATFVRKSVGDRSLNVELYGSEQKQEQIRLVVGEAFSYLGVISSDAVQDVLLRLAVDNHPAVQMVAAQAMAHWRLHGHDYKLYQTLRTWYDGAHFVEQVNKLVDENNSQTQAGLAYIRSTVALTVALAGMLDSPNQLADELVEQFAKLAKDENKLVRERFVTYTLPLVLTQHWVQLREHIEEMVLQADFITPIAFSLANAYRFSPEKVIHQLEQWQAECQRLSVDETDSRPKWREAMLAMVILTYGYLPYKLMTVPVSEEEVAQLLIKTVLDKSEHPFVKTMAVDVLAFSLREQLERHFDEFEPGLCHFLTYAHPREQDLVVDILIAAYVFQRRRLKGGDRTITLNSESYEMWTSRNRPLTKAEKAMFAWIKQPDNVNAQQIALQALVAFVNEFDRPLYEEATRIAQGQQDTNRVRSKGKTRSAERHVSTSSQVYYSPNTLGIDSQFGLWLATSGQEEKTKAVLRGIFPEARRQLKKNPAAYYYARSRWLTEDRDSKDEEMRKIAKLLAKAHNWTGIFPVSLLMFACLLAYLLLAAISSLFG